MSEKAVESFNPKTEICRLCLSYTKVYIYMNQNEKICQMLNSFTAIEIDPTDETSIICYKCHLNIKLAYFIQQNMIKAEEKFQQQILTVRIKEEVQPELIKQEELGNIGELQPQPQCNEIFPEMEQLRQMCSNFMEDTNEDTLYQPVTTKMEVDEYSSNDTYCKIGNQYYTDRTELLNHQKLLHSNVKCQRITEYEKKPHTFCKLCNRHYGTRKKLKEHYQKFHPHYNVGFPQVSYKCETCDKVFQTRGSLTNHSKSHTERICCPKCPTVVRSYKLEQHMEQHHQNVLEEQHHQDVAEQPQRSHQCEVCQKTFSTKRCLTNHAKSHIERICCSKCSKIIPLYKLEQHMEKHHQDVVEEQHHQDILEQPSSHHQCEICQKSFPTKGCLTNHVKSHTEHICCPKCPSVVRSYKLEQHMEQHHNNTQEETIGQPEICQISQQTNHQCEICQKVFSRRGYLTNHIKSHNNRMKCPKCPSIVRNYKLAQHIEHYHNKKKSEKVPEETIDKNFICATCHKVFQNKRKYTNHVLAHGRSDCPICGKNITTVNLHHHMSNTHSSTAQQICEICGATLKNKGCLRVHMQVVHQEAQHKCNFCDRLFKRKTARRQHEIKEHLRQANFVCDTCGKKFYTRKYLKTHVDMKHLKLRPYKCEFCQKAFSSDTAMKTHRRIHTNETPYKCDVCGEGFRQNVSLKSHLKSKHNITEKLTVFCKVCDKGFASEVALYTHQRVHE